MFSRLVGGCRGVGLWGIGREGVSERMVVSREGRGRTDDTTMGEAGLYFSRRLVCVLLRCPAPAQLRFLAQTTITCSKWRVSEGFLLLPISKCLL